MNELLVNKKSSTEIFLLFFFQHIDEISIKSSFLNSEFTKLISLVVKDVRINKDITTRESATNGNTVKNQSITENVMDFRDKKVPYFITSFAQVTRILASLIV